ncbi:MAG: hypothetical protein HeimAB125_05490 [Candidatus Heimdallarchaeota archaeon AB_125]|nr:MAG: hypothetical protein HeimAB125_05490 [Candidatus Heimdallarchaeota archaeon AB_125]
MGKIGKLIGSLIFLGLFGSWFTFTIWGIVTWDSPTLVSQIATLALFYVPLFIGIFILFIIGLIITGATGKKKDKKKDEETDWMKKIGGFFAKEAKSDTTFDGKDIEAMIPKDVIEKISKFIKEKSEEAEK